MPLNSSEDNVRAGAGSQVFRTLENALGPGWHEWQTNYLAGQALQEGEDWRATGLSCLTTVLRAS